MQLIEIDEEEFDSLYIAEKLNDNILIDEIFEDYHFCEIDVGDDICLYAKARNMHFDELYLELAIQTNINVTTYVCLLEDSLRNREYINKIIKEYQIEYIDRRKK